MPVSSGSALSNCVNASSPPAEAPMPTIGNNATRLRSSRATAASSVGAGVSTGVSDGIDRFFFMKASGLCKVFANESHDLRIRHLVRRLQFNEVRRKLLALKSLLEFALRLTGANDQNRVRT